MKIKLNCIMNRKLDFALTLLKEGFQVQLENETIVNVDETYYDMGIKKTIGIDINKSNFSIDKQELIARYIAQHILIYYGVEVWSALIKDKYDDTRVTEEEGWVEKTTMKSKFDSEILEKIEKVINENQK